MIRRIGRQVECRALGVRAIDKKVTVHNTCVNDHILSVFKDKSNDEVATAMKGKVMNFTTDRRTYLKLSVLAASAAVGLTACGQGGAADGPVTLRFAWWGGDVRHKLTEKIIENFNAAHPNITVKGEYSDWSGYWDKLATQVAANDSPDIIQMDEKYVREYGDRGALFDLKQIKDLQTKDYDPITLNTGEVDGKLVGLVAGIGTLAIAANLNVLKEAEVELPDDTTWSWDDYLELGREIGKKIPGTMGVGIGTTDGDLYIWARQHGDRLYDDDGNVVIKPETLASFWRRLLTASQTGATGKPSAFIEASTAALDQTPMATGKMGLTAMWNTQLVAFAGAHGEDLKLLRLPGESQAVERGAYYKSSMFWSVSARTKNQEAAQIFLNYLVNDQASGDLLLAERGVPANNVVRAAIADKVDATGRLAIEYTDAIADEVRPAPPITPAGGSAIDAILARYASDILFERVTPEAAAPAFIKELSDSIKK